MNGHFLRTTNLWYRAWLNAMKHRVFRRQLIAIFVCVVFAVYLTLSFLIDDNPQRKLPTVYMNLLPKAFPRLMTSSTPARRVHDVSCAAILANDRQEIERAINISKNFPRKIISDEQYITMTHDCDLFKVQRGYHNFKQTTEEEDFPIAFSILLYKEVEQAERLLRAIYRPQNIYCFHVDADSTPEVHTAVDSIARCFTNVFVVSRKEYIVYAGFSRLQADLNCMANLLERGKTWKYFINLPSQQFPLKTNSEIVKILKVYNGSNDIEGIVGNRRNLGRFSHRHFYKYNKDKVKPGLFKTNQIMPDPPYNISIVKGSAYGIFSRRFVEYIHDSKIARALLDYMREVYSPDEFYWSCLNHNPHIGAPGSFSGPPDKKPWYAVWVRWGGGHCEGKFVRGVCVFGVGDLHDLVDQQKRPELFVNKFHLDFQPLALDCMEEWIFNRSLSESTASRLNLTVYQSAPFVKQRSQGIGAVAT